MSGGSRPFGRPHTPPHHPAQDAPQPTASLFDDEANEQGQHICSVCRKNPTGREIAPGVFVCMLCDPQGWKAGVRRFDPDTSVVAAKANPRRRNLLRDLALTEIRKRPSTTDEIHALHPELHLPTLSRRVSDLRDVGLVKDSGRRRRTRRGSAATVWMAVPE